ncbi:MAG: DEAD/DEAH box helicase [Coriobacteriia bacterium]|nr:DEAD/DEAH box helicase [Coriobacteriia bacterium]MCL2745759.1 DEAD/DEAH box helicase [Coriobacteriia bacterium]MCL2870528.1 DEAD/DEAH box helicase [Coriobacteriia bacterium]
MKKFEDLGLDPNLLKALSKLNYEDPTPVQEQAIPSVLEGRHVVACAQTGTGKTAAFVLPLMQRITRSSRKRPIPHALIVVPTRELAAQVEKVARVVAQPYQYKVRSVVGGIKYKPQLERLSRGVDVLVATPGRLLDLIDDRKIDLSHVQILVLDEADRMLDMGFWPPVKKILSMVPADCQKLLFSATIGKEINKMVGMYMPDSAKVEVARKGETAQQITQSCMPVEHGQKADLLLALLSQRSTGKTLIFTRTKRRADMLSRILGKNRIKSQAIHGGRSQPQRTRALKDFTTNRIDILVTTDVMARGIHVDNIDTVINYDVPVSPEDYVHRIGRTGRAGQMGDAITFVAPEEISAFRDIEFLTKSLISVVDLEDFPYKEGRIVPSKKRSAAKEKPKPFQHRSRKKPSRPTSRPRGRRR